MMILNRNKLPFYNRHGLFADEHLDFKERFSGFLSEIKESFAKPDIDKQTAIKLAWNEAGKRGFVCPAFHGKDFLYSVLIAEETFRNGMPDFGLFVHNEIASHYLLAPANSDIDSLTMEKITSGKTILALALTEPDSGSDLSSLCTTAKKVDGSYIINGRKIFISNGFFANAYIVAARTSNTTGPHGVTLFFVPHEKKILRTGIRTNGLSDLGLSEILFKDTRAGAIIGKIDSGFRMIVEQFSRERFIVAIAAMAATETMLDLTIEYAKNRHSFGKAISSHQAIQFALADAVAKTTAQRGYIDSLIKQHMGGESIDDEAEIAKHTTTTLQLEVAGVCKRVWGGQAIAENTPVAKLFQNADAQLVYAGSSEMMKTAIAKKWKI